MKDVQGKFHKVGEKQGVFLSKLRGSGYQIQSWVWRFHFLLNIGKKTLPLPNGDIQKG
nr:hypothetical protein [uncultured Bacillus sp.]